ncbi:MAG: Gfo/Idh/MocA family oxidoreductase [Actinobacteria bacterium]|nr:Gfo/Idh/MocA family oxidoreductase [Actinomycetota bacterium]
MIRLGVVGTGWILGAHLTALQQLRTIRDDVVITAIATRDPARLRGLLFGNDEGVDAVDRPAAPPIPRLSDVQPGVIPSVHADHRELVAAGEVDALLDLTPPFRHHEVARDAIAAGLHVLTEKPLAVSVALGRAMVEAAERAGVVLAVAEQVRCMDRPRAERHILASGGIGELRLVEWPSLGSPWARSRVVAGTPWRHQRAQAGGGTGFDNGVHSIDWLRFTVGDIDSVQAVAHTFCAERGSDDGSMRVSADVEDYVSAHLRFRNGALGHLSLSWLDDGERVLPRYVGSRASLDGSDDLGDRLPPGALTWPGEAGELGPYARQLLHFVRAVTGDGEPAVSAREGLADICVSLAILESALAGCWVDVEDVASGRLREAQRSADLVHRFDS